MDRAPTIVAVGSLPKITFSAWVSLKRCALKGTLGQATINGELPKSAPSRANLIGTFHHKALELASRGYSPDELRLSLESEIERCQRTVTALPALRRFGSVSGWDEINRSVSLAHDLAAAKGRGVGGGASNAAAETGLRSASGLMEGKPDFFWVNESGATLREYKSVGIRDEDGELLADYLDQVKFYSVLIFDNFDVPIVKASVESLSGDRCDVAVSPAEARQFSMLVEQALREFNRSVEAPVKPETLATPSREACAYCNGRVACEPFKRLQDQLELEGEQYLIQGMLVRMEPRSANWVATIGEVYRDKRIQLSIPEEVARQLRSESAYIFFNLRRQGPAFSWGHSSRVMTCA
jgi:PD-(D/E)XK nuclease superfamily